MSNVMELIVFPLTFGVHRIQNGLLGEQVRKLPTALSRVHLGKLMATYSRNSVRFFRTCRYHFTRACHCSLSWAISVESRLSHLASLTSLVILSSHLCLGLASCPFTLGFLTFCIHFSSLPCVLHAMHISLWYWTFSIKNKPWISLHMWRNYKRMMRPLETYLWYCTDFRWREFNMMWNFTKVTTVWQVKVYQPVIGILNCDRGRINFLKH